MLNLVAISLYCHTHEVLFDLRDAEVDTVVCKPAVRLEVHNICGFHCQRPIDQIGMFW